MEISPKIPKIPKTTHFNNNNQNKVKITTKILKARTTSTTTAKINRLTITMMV